MSDPKLSIKRLHPLPHVVEAKGLDLNKREYRHERTYVATHEVAD